MPDVNADKVSNIGDILDELYPEPPIPLNHDDAFTLLVAVVLSAQTTDERVNKVTPGLFELARTPEEMAELSVDAIQEAIKTCGLAPTKAERIKGLSEQIIEDFDGEVPDVQTHLQKLPGVGRKTAQVVLAQWFDQPTFPVDTHIHRLAERWALSDGSTVRQTEKDLKAAFPQETWNRRHLQIIYFGREHCPARQHDPDACKICSWAMPDELKQQAAE
jgi:endonuclease-3